MNKEYFKIKELAQYLSLKPKTLYSWVESGKIPAYKINGVLRFKVQEIKDYVDAGKVVPADPEKEARKILGKRFLLRHNPLDSGHEAPRSNRS